MQKYYNKCLFSKIQIFIAVFPGLALFFTFLIFPAIINIIYSFTDYKPLSPNPLKWVGFQNYTAIFSQRGNFDLLVHAIGNTLKIAILVSVVQNLIAILFAVLLNNKIRLRNFYRAIIFLPVTLGVVIQGLVWTLAFNPYNGTYARALTYLGVNSTYFGDSKIAIYLIIVIIIWANIGFAMTIYLSGLQGIPMDIYESGLIDGASGFRAFRYITLPLLMGSVRVNVLLCVIGAINMLDIIVVTTNGGPGFATYNLPYLVFFHITTSGKTQGFAAAVSILQFLFTLFFVIVAQRLMKGKEVEL